MSQPSLLDFLEGTTTGPFEPVVVPYGTVESASRDQFVQLKKSKQVPPLFDYQKDLVKQVSDCMSLGGKGLVTLPTGGGKTRTAAFAVLEFLKTKPDAKILWIAPTVELLDQASQTLKSLWEQTGEVPDLEIFRGLTKGTHGTISLLAPHSLFSNIAKSKLRDWDALIFDEAHQIAAPEFLESVKKVQENSPNLSLIGLSATPGRTDESENSTLADIFDGNLMFSRILGQNPVEFLQKRGILSQLSFADLSGGKKLASTEKLKLAALKCIELAAKNKKVLVFTENLTQSQQLAEALCGVGVPSVHVEGALEADLRKGRIDAFARGDARVLTNQKLLTTGYDCPAVSDLIIMPTVGSPILFEQMVGRAARGPRTGGTSKSTIWQFADHLALYGLPQSYYRYKDYVWN